MDSYKVVTRVEELDEILPMIEEFHKTQNYCNLYSHSGYLQWLLSSLPFLRVYIAYCGERAIGYSIAGIQYTFGSKECIIYEGFIAERHPFLVNQIYEDILLFAKESGCSHVFCCTEHEKVKELMEKRGFEVVRSYLTKKI